MRRVTDITGQRFNKWLVRGRHPKRPNMRHNSGKRNLEFSLTYEEFVNFTKTDTCHYCEGQVVWVKHGHDGNTFGPYNLDRKDNTRGYVTGNLVVCCHRCNRVKSNYFSYEEMLELGKTIRKMRESKLAMGASNVL